MKDTTCPICESPAQEGPGTGDNIVFECPDCRGYRLSRTALTLLGNGMLQRPDPAAFRKLVRSKKGDSDEYARITKDDLESI